MADLISRRKFLQVAGGVTFLALVPNGKGLFAADIDSTTKLLPVFPALPYIQPGNNSVLVDGKESVVIAWQTNGTDADFVVTYGINKAKSSGIVSRVGVSAGNDDDSEVHYNYQAVLPNLSLGTKYNYTVSCNGSPIMAGFFTTRKPRGTAIRFVAFGDNSFGDISDRAIAFQAYSANPDFVMNTGDNVYDGGLGGEYNQYFFPVYNSPLAGPRDGAPLLRSVPFYTVIANHDVHRSDANKHPIADFDKDPDALAYFTNMSLPLNGPVPTYPTPTTEDSPALRQFKKAAGSRFPTMANYSFDYGDAHFLCLDANVYVDPTDPALNSWITSDLKGTDATWKFVVFHHPPFNVGEEHYQEQHMRVLSPLFESVGVDMTFHGHEHTYQRTQPIRFAPQDASAASKIGSKVRLVSGRFAVDTTYDGAKNLLPNGIIYITTGAGGKHLYDPTQNEDPTTWLHAEDGNVAYVTKMVTDRHSLTVIDIDGKNLTLAQVDEFGDEIDRIQIEKA